MTDDAKPMDRYQRWRLANPEKARAQQERKRLRAKGLLPPYQRPPPAKGPDDRKAYMKEWHRKRMENPESAQRYKDAQRARARAHYLKIKADPELHAAHLERRRNANRAAKGIPLDAPVKAVRLTPEERRQRNAEYKRKVYRIKHGIPLDAPIGVARKSRAKTAKPAIDKERARRAAEVEAAKAAAAVKKSLTTEKPICPDPPELQELFRKASKGEPPRPFPAAGRKRSVFHLRGAY